MEEGQEEEGRQQEGGWKTDSQPGRKMLISVPMQENGQEADGRRKKARRTTLRGRRGEEE